VITVVLLLLLSTISLVACKSGPDETRTNTYSVGSSPSINVQVGNGDLDIVIGAEGEITVVAELYDLGRIEYKVAQDGDAITVSAKTKSDSRADIAVTVPQNCTFELSTGNGRVDTADLQASGRVNTGNGGVMLEQIIGDVQINVGNGDITVDDVEGSFSLNSGNGNIDLLAANGTFILNVGNGDITFRGELASGSVNTFNTGSGSITAELTGSPSVVLDLETDDGEVKSDLPMAVSEKSKYRLVGTIGEGGAELTIRAGSGDITIK
jgi:DUF4097 and DUF4098 domain-containing protein YvlB